MEPGERCITRPKAMWPISMQPSFGVMRRKLSRPTQRCEALSITAKNCGSALAALPAIQASNPARSGKGP
ncbi:hypothetical protein D3C76_1429050 [compost metagenome]